MSKSTTYDVVVVGGGHAGCEAASAAARLGCQTLLVTQDRHRLAEMSCNPAIGGLAKGHLVREIDALGGIMGIVTDRATIQSRMLNRSKGPAVWSPRAQCDRRFYTRVMVEMIEATEHLEILEDEVVDLTIQDGVVTGVKNRSGVEVSGRKVVLCGGTFWNGVIHIGEWSQPAGRIGESPAVGLSQSLEGAGLRRLRFKTGTPPRLDGKTIDFERLERQDGDTEPVRFSDRINGDRLPQVACFLTFSNPTTHAALEKGLDRSPLYQGRIQGTGPRYCPSIEDKVVRFAGRDRHQLFLEPEGLDTDEYYINGFSTSLPEDIQIEALHTVPGLENVVMNRPGYAVEYDVFPADQLLPSLECRTLKNLYLAGQINGTSGYEEAAAQGFMAGVNAARDLAGKPPIVLGRDQAYTGVLIDDLITKIPEEPYRMFTSRAEFRLLLRQDNARERLLPVAREIGLLDEFQLKEVEEDIRMTADIVAELRRIKVKLDGHSVLAAVLLKRPEETLATVSSRGVFSEAFRAKLDEHPRSAFQAVMEIKYAGYLDRQRSQVEAFRRMEDFRIPADYDYLSLKALSNEARKVLDKVRPGTLGQASRIPGVRAADISVLMIMLQRGSGPLKKNLK